VTKVAFLGRANQSFNFGVVHRHSVIRLPFWQSYVGIVMLIGYFDETRFQFSLVWQSRFLPSGYLKHHHRKTVSASGPSGSILGKDDCLPSLRQACRRQCRILLRLRRADGLVERP
jgi:hypothetical protein